MFRSSAPKRAVTLGWALLMVIAGSVAVSAGTFRLLQPIQSDVLSYSDVDITITFKMRPGEYGIGYEGIGFIITNNSDRAIEIDWDRSSMTLANGQTSNVMHEGTRFITSGTSTPPTTIPPGGRLSDSVIPTRNISYYEGWNVGTLGLKAGSRFGLYLAINGIETRSGYNFTFEAVEVESEARQTFSFILVMLALVAVLGLVSLALDL